MFERFGESRESYDGLYWSHFQAALDWNDAEMWLEGAVQNDWSISEMRRQRGETLGESPSTKRTASRPADWDEDAEPLPNEQSTDSLTGKLDLVRPAQKPIRSTSKTKSSRIGTPRPELPTTLMATTIACRRRHAEPVRPFANLARLPADVSEAFESFKLCILKHKLAGWMELSRDEMLAALDALKELALRPPGRNLSFLRANVAGFVGEHPSNRFDSQISRAALNGRRQMGLRARSPGRVASRLRPDRQTPCAPDKSTGATAARPSAPWCGQKR